MAQGNACDHAAIDHPQKKAGDQNGDVQQRDVLAPKTVNQIEEEVQQKNHPAQNPGSVGKSAAHQRQRQHGDKQQHCTGDRDGAGGNGAAALAGIFAVVFPIPDVVDDVNGRGQQREREKCQNAGNEAIMLEKLTAAQERKKNQQIFNPVFGAEELEQIVHGAS